VKFRPRFPVFLFLPILASAAGAPAQTQPGAGNSVAQEIAQASPLVREAIRNLTDNTRAIQDEHLRTATLDALTNPQTCVVHRARLTEEDKQRIIQQLVGEHLLNAAEGDAIPGGVVAGVFPPVLDDGTACPHLSLAFGATPGSSFGSHHSFPGGLAVHESFNQQNAMNLAALYRRTYAEGLSNPIDQDAIIAAPAWHDWAKMLVFQWNADGTEFKEMNFGGTGMSDSNIGAGDSRTGAHHILSLAETMARGLLPLVVITQASAHAAPVAGNQYKVVNWLRAAAIIARVDPVAKGYLIKDANGAFKVPRMRIEYQIGNLSDADFVNSVPAATAAETILQQAAPRFGYDPADAPAYNTRFRNVVLARLSAERIELINSRSGLAGVEAEIGRLGVAEKSSR